MLQFSSSLAAVLMTTVLGVFCAAGVSESEVEVEVTIELAEAVVHRRDCLVDKSIRHVRLPFKPQFFSESPTSLSVPLGFYSERTNLNGLGMPLLT